MYLTFLLDLAGGGDNRAMKATVRYEPTPLVPKNAFAWTVTCDVQGTVVVRGHHRGRYRVIGSGRWERDALIDRRQIDTSPTDYQWKLVEDALRAEIARAHGGFADDPSWIERFDPTELRTRGEYKTAVRARPARTKGDWFPYALFGSCGLIVVAFIAGGIHDCRRELRDHSAPLPTASTASPTAAPSSTSSGASTGSSTAAPPSGASTAASPSPIDSAPDLAAAIALARPTFAHSDDPLAGGATLLARYASRRMRWADVGTPDTTIGHALRDVDAERGRRLCATGTVEHIERRDLEARKVFIGRMTTADGDAVTFVVVGNVGDIVKRSRASLCGIVTGATPTTLNVVGMFDLPENRAPLVESER